MLHDGHDYSVIHLVAACFRAWEQLCVRVRTETRSTCHGFGAGLHGELVPVVETGLANLVDVLARAVSTRAGHQCGH